MKKFLPFIILSLLLTQLSGVLAQISKGGFPPSYLQSQTLNGVEERIVRPENFPLIQQEDEENAKIGVVFRYGVWVDVNAGIENSGTWTVLPDGQRIWRLMITAPGAKAIAVHFDQFLLPEGAKVFVYNNTKDHIIGAFDKDNNHESRLLATELVKGEAIIIEYVAPPMNPEGFIEKRNTTDKEKQGFNPNLPLLSIGKIIYAYREVGFLFPNGDGNAEKSCMVGVNCSPEGSAWQDQKRGVARVSVVDGSGAGWCSGSLVNNVNGDCTPYFLLADHCGGTATSYMNQWVFYFNYEASSSNCQSATGPTNQSMTGATFKARGPMSGGSDFLLLQLNQALPSTYNLYVNGWNRGTTASSSGVSIHHPAGRVKKISTYTQALSTYTYSGCMANAHWLVYWAQTTNGHAVTEGGSSGSPIFDNNKRIVGTLTGGGSYCNAVTSPDMYGKMSTHWEANGTADNRRLRKWLDPNNTVTTLDGKYCGGGSSSSLVCTNAINLTCGQTYTGTTVGGASNVSTYNCQTWNESGPEKVHKIVTGSTGTITATLSGMSVDLDVFILSGCNETQCVASGDNSASYANAPAGTYYIVVDGYNGASGAYTLNVTCSGGGTPSSCDTISNVGSSESLTYYSPQSGWGFYPGHNSSTISAYADYYTNTGTKYIKHAWVPVAKAHAGSSSSSVVFKAWNGSGATPGNALGSKSFQINTFTVNQWKLIDFTTPIAVSGNFYFGFEINYGSPQDTFAVYCAAHRTSGTNTAFLYFNSAWQSFATAFSGNLNTSLGIEPVICTTVDVADYPELEDKIQVFPNPANDMVAIDFEFFKSNIEAIIIYDVIGKVKGEINPRDLENNKAVISLDSFDAGLYLISVKTKDKTVVNKFTVIK
jgi:hypothetical protein